MLEQFIRQGYAECERIEGNGTAKETGTAREIAMIKTKFEEAGALLANAEAKAITGRPLLDLPTLGMIQNHQSGLVDDDTGGPFDRGTPEQWGREQEAQTAGAGYPGGHTSAGPGGGGGTTPGGGESQR